MKIGMVVYSETGNTFSVAKKIEKGFKKVNVDVLVSRITLIDKYDSNRPFEFKHVPLLDKYDVVIIGSPVEAFSLSKVTRKYLDNVESFAGKKIFLFVTEYFPYPWMGGNNAIRKMKKIIVSKGGEIINTGVVNWTNKRRYEMEDEIVEAFISNIKSLV